MEKHFHYLISCYHLHVEIHCGSLETPTNGSKIGSNDVVNSVVTFSCDYGFRINGSALRNCTDQETWDGEVATCVGQYTFH